MNAILRLIGVSVALLAAFRFVQGGSVETLYGNGYIYNYHADYVDWNEAEFKCPYYNDGHLAIIKDAGMDEDVKELIDAWQNRESWIGLLDTYTEQYWYWIDGTKVADYYENWRQGEPNDYFGEDCGTYVTPGYQWNDKDCGSKFGFICQLEDSVSTALASTEYVIRDRKSDRTYDGTHESAQERCSSFGYRLAEVSSAEVISEIKKNSKWRPMANYWVNGQSRCLTAGTRGTLSGLCDGELGYICEAMYSYDVKLSNREQDYMESETVKVDCTAHGLPAPNVTWYKLHGLVGGERKKRVHQISELGKSTLVIVNARLEDTSRYRCIATNVIEGRNKTAKTYLDIRVHPESKTKVVKGRKLSKSFVPHPLTPARSAVDNGNHQMETEGVAEACPTDFSTVTWMLPTIFALNIMILLAMAVLLCSKRSEPSRSAALKLGFSNEPVYSITHGHLNP